MLYAFGFERYSVVVGDLYHLDPNPGKGQEGPERGVRLELRVLGRGKLNGSIYSAQPIAVENPVWRVDLLETADGPPGSFDRTHHHPAFRGWEPGRRVFVPELSADPVSWIGDRLSDLPGILEQAGADKHDTDAADAEALRACVPEILDAVQRLLTKVHSGALAIPPDGQATSIRTGWL